MNSSSGTQHTSSGSWLHSGDYNGCREDVEGQLREVEMHNGTLSCSENQGDKLKDVHHPDMPGSPDQESEDDSEEHADNDGMNPELTHNGQPEVISTDVRQPPATAQERTASGPSLGPSVSEISLRTRRRSKKTTSPGSTLNCNTRLADRKGAWKLRSVPAQGNQANLECGATGSRSESKLPAAIGEKIDRIGGVAVLEELRDTISDLRLHTCPLPAVVQESALVKPKYLRTGPPLAHKLLLLKEELKLTELSEQIYRLRKRLALAEFYTTYSAAQAQADSSTIGEDGEYLSNKPARKRRRRNRSSHFTPAARKARVASSVQKRFVDLLFPETVTISASLTTEDQARRELLRKAAV